MVDADAGTIRAYDLNAAKRMLTHAVNSVVCGDAAASVGRTRAEGGDNSAASGGNGLAVRKNGRAVSKKKQKQQQKHKPNDHVDSHPVPTDERDDHPPLLKSETKTRQTSTDAVPGDSWPMWPFRLIQIQTCCIYTGAGFGKLLSDSDMWWPNLATNANAMYFVVNQQDFFGGVFQPNIIYDCVGVLKVMTIASVLLECSCWFLVWPLRTRTSPKER